MTEKRTRPATDAERGQVNTAAAEVYESFFVPALFGQFVESVLDHGGVTAGSRVLDVGCGTGVVARAAAARVGDSGCVVGVDPNEGMLRVAQRAEPAVDWRPGSAEALPVEDRAFDHTISQFAAMFFTDRAEAINEMARATARGGTVTIATWCQLGRTPGYDAMVALIADELGDDAANALRAPFVLGEPDDVRQLLDSVGNQVDVTETTGTARFASIADWVHTDVRGWTLADLVDDEQEVALIARAESQLDQFVAADGSVSFPAPAIIATVTIRG